MNKEQAAYLEKLRSIGGIVKGGTPKFHKVTHEDMTAIYKSTNSPLAKVTADKAMFKAITQGNASDKSLTRDVAAVIGPSEDKAKKRAEKLERIKKLKARYRSRYGKDA